ncbi:NAD-dependent epimerase/dehydratase family protein [Heliophilum fasciatum]|uniref:Nucleoside-diphosphate-sugar epimerase n=1 Tax=Heliophilum fasciatum TaxID=35700 RepID=A0A4R2RJU9_9FIRM|nr:NAD-dependent epimerase/dehydratase family protein [Heliophilum fasciatum]TCP64110.1 nucleoside-diphosphate-sugar epimerase [Heliophilum fasciatum]
MVSVVNKSVLVTGATGFVGSHLVKGLVGDGWDVHIIVRSRSNLEQIENKARSITVHVHDGTMQGMNDIMAQASPYIVIHLAALFIGEHRSQDVEPLIQSNILFGAQLLEAMRQTNVAFMVNTGTHWQHYEHADYNPTSLYAATKQAFIDLACYYTQATPLRMITLKLADTYGPHDPRPKIFSLLRRIAISGELLKMSPGEQELGFVYVDDVVEAFIAAIELIQTQPEHYQDDFFVLPEKCYTLREIVRLYEKISGLPLAIEWGARPYRKREMMKVHRGKPLPRWRAKVDLFSGILRMLQLEQILPTD